MNEKFFQEKLLTQLGRKNPNFVAFLSRYPNFNYIPIEALDYVKRKLKALGFNSKQVRYYYRTPSPKGSKGYYELARKNASAFRIYFRFDKMGWAFPTHYYLLHEVPYTLNHAWGTDEGKQFNNYIVFHY